jgi:Transposase, Mutator family
MYWKVSAIRRQRSARSKNDCLAITSAARSARAMHSGAGRGERIQAGAAIFDYYEHGAQPGQGYRNGYRTGRLKTAEGLMDYSAPQIAGREEPFRSTIREHLKGHTQGLEDLAVEMLARGLSVRDIEDAFKDETGRLLLSRTAVSQLGERLWEDYQSFVQRDLSEHEISYLFIDGMPNGCGLGPSASRFWRPGASRLRAAGCCST